MFDAMQAGPPAEEKMMSLFTDDAVMIDPFSGQPETCNGKESIRKRFLDLWSQDGPHDLQLSLDKLETDGESIVVDWTCRSAAFKTPMLGQDTFRIRDGKIARLEMNVTGWPEMEGGH